MAGSRMRPFVVIKAHNTAAELDPCAALELADTDRGLLLNRLTSDQRDGIVDPTPGLTIYNTDTMQLETWNDSEWAPNGALFAVNNLSDLNNPEIARLNLGLGTSATTAASGMELLASGTITDPVEYFDLTLPDGYPCFRLVFSDLFLSATDYFSFAISYDAGATFVNDIINFDSYQFLQFRRYGNDNEGAVNILDATNGTDALIGMSDLQAPAADIGMSMSLDIFPGSASELMYVVGHSVSFKPDIYYNSGVIYLSPYATTPPVKARINLLRFVPYGNGDVDPPTSGETITAGTYFLWGTPTP